MYTPLSPQHAWTIEVGTRGEYSRFRWELSLYRSWFRNELLELNDIFGNDIGTANVPRSIHQGIEASLEVENEIAKNLFVSVGYQFVHGLKLPVYLSVNGVPNGTAATWP